MDFNDCPFSLDNHSHNYINYYYHILQTTNRRKHSDQINLQPKLILSKRSIIIKTCLMKIHQNPPVVPGDVNFESGTVFPVEVLSNELISPQADGSESKRESPSLRINVLKGDMSPWLADDLPSPLLFPVADCWVSCLVGFGLMLVRSEPLLCRLEPWKALSSWFEVTIVGKSSADEE